ncbi:MAG: ABC transporter substrate-binding protein [Proteobacteria bacterium]|nr:ABC transporter substrate-binding protein [Pseudomonadota bacterium]
MSRYLLLTLLVTFLPLQALAEHADSTPYTYIYNAPESDLDVRYQYHWEILQTALEKTRPKYGGYAMTPSPRMSEKRQTAELMKGSELISVMYLGTTQEFEKKLIPIRIPVDKNLGGYNVFLVRRDSLGKFADVQSIKDLQKFSYGLGSGWVDVGILESNGFTVITGSSYDGLFRMLVERRFDIFLRGAVEVLDEVEQRKHAMPDLRIEDSIVLYYPLPMYFWFSKNAQGQKLAQRAEEGMRMMIADGSFDRIFEKYQRHKIEQLHLRTRKIFRINNPYLVRETPFDDKRLWFDPLTDKRKFNPAQSRQGDSRH